MRKEFLVGKTQEEAYKMAKSEGFDVRVVLFKDACTLECCNNRVTLFLDEKRNVSDAWVEERQY